MSIADELNTTYMRLRRDLQEDRFAYASEREVLVVELPDGREAQVTMKLNVDPEEWM